MLQCQMLWKRECPGALRFWTRSSIQHPNGGAVSVRHCRFSQRSQTGSGLPRHSAGQCSTGVKSPSSRRHLALGHRNTLNASPVPFRRCDIDKVEIERSADEGRLERFYKNFNPLVIQDQPSYGMSQRFVAFNADQPRTSTQAMSQPRRPDAATGAEFSDHSATHLGSQHR